MSSRLSWYHFTINYLYISEKVLQINLRRLSFAMRQSVPQHLKTLMHLFWMKHFLPFGCWWASDKWVRKQSYFLWERLREGGWKSWMMEPKSWGLHIEVLKGCVLGNHSCTSFLTCFFFHGFCCCLNCASFASNILTLLNHSYLINYQSFSQTKVKTKTMHAACPNKQCNHCFLLVLSRMFHQNVQGIISYISYLNREQSN